MLRSILLSKNDRVARILTLLLKDFEIQLEVCADLDEAKGKLFEGKCDGIFADCELAESLELLRCVRKSKHNKRSIAFAIIGSETPMGVAFQAGAHFVIHKPITVETSKRTLRAAHGLMMREKRLQYRNLVTLSATAKTYGHPPVGVTLLDICRDGALIESHEVRLQKGQLINLRFPLPGTKLEVAVECTVRWADLTGHAGLHFEVIPEQTERVLAQWVKEMSVDGEKVESIEAPAVLTGIERFHSAELS